MKPAAIRPLQLVTSNLSDASTHSNKNPMRITKEAHGLKMAGQYAQAFELIRHARLHMRFSSKGNQRTNVLRSCTNLSTLLGLETDVDESAIMHFQHASDYLHRAAQALPERAQLGKRTLEYQAFALECLAMVQRAIAWRCVCDMKGIRIVLERLRDAPGYRRLSGCLQRLEKSTRAAIAPNCERREAKICATFFYVSVMLANCGLAEESFTLQLLVRERVDALRASNGEKSP